ncbi:delphilin [Elysia marginata]|uniref:Delphilin n=1 Tax=Elysia marginata TaxID=1093978 RepID=A0AAV4JQG9_9GAST|nr:delphilin [Elysia marginata]
MGNYLNHGNHRIGEAAGFRITFLTQLEITKTTDKKSSFLHVVAETIYSKFPELLSFSDDLPSIVPAAKVPGDQHFLAEATDELQSIFRLQAGAVAEFSQMVSFFGENPKSMTTNDVFSIFSDFIGNFECLASVGSRGQRGRVAEWLARRTCDLEVVGSIPDHVMLQLPWESDLP